MELEGSPCPICKRPRTYKTKIGLEKGRTKPCRSCSNSIQLGGVGWSDICVDCGIRPKTGRHNSQCKECHNIRSKKYHKEVYRWAKYGLDGPVEMTECEICKSKDDLVIDHCHDTNQYRGILCRTCNMGIGHLRESKEVIRKALEYAERTFNGFS